MIARPQIKIKIFCDTEAIKISGEIFHIADFDTKTGLL